MPFRPDDNDQVWRPVEMPFVAGCDLRQPSRLVQAPTLTRAENVRFDTARSGLKRRRGHKRIRVQGATALDTAPSAGAYLYGAGVVGGPTDEATSGGAESGIPGPPGSLEETPGPYAGALFGMAKRDQEVLAWDGWRLFSWPPSTDPGTGWQDPVDAKMPVARSYPVAKTASAQAIADAAVADGIAVVAWIDVRDAGDPTARYTLYDPVTMAPFTVDQALDLGMGNVPVQIRAVPCGAYVHVFVLNDANHIDMFTANRTAPRALVDNGNEPGDDHVHMDVYKVDEDSFLVAFVHVDGNIEAIRYGASGNVVRSMALTDPMVQDAARFVAVTEHPVTGEVAVFWVSDDDPHTAWLSVFNHDGTNGAHIEGILSLGTDLLRVAVSPTFITRSDNGAFNCYLDTVDGDGFSATYRVQGTRAGQVGSFVLRYGHRLASSAWRVGNDTFVTLFSVYANVDNPLQNAYFTVDEALLPVGRLEYGTAEPSDFLTSVHTAPGATGRNQHEFRQLLVVRTRVDSANDDQFDEQSLKLVEWDFLGPCRSAAFGRCTYFAGAQLHEYDGAHFTEAGFHQYPEAVDGTASGSGSQPDGAYIYKARWAWKDAQGQECLSATAFTQTVTASTEAIDLTGAMLYMTRKEGAYLLLYRNEASGTAWYLVSSRDPSTAGDDNGYIANDPDGTVWTFTDAMSDADLIGKEQDTIGNAGELEPFSAPACEIVAAGRDRLWLVGGELPSGDVLPSKTYTDGRSVQFNQFLQTTIDRGGEPLTAIAFMGNSSIVFKRSRVFAFESDGPNNLGQGSFDPPRVIATDVGAVEPEGVLLTTEGIWYHAESGVKLLATNYLIQDVGEPVWPLAADADWVASVMIERDQEVRFYCRDAPALVFNTSAKGWTTWPGLQCVGAVTGPSGLMVLGMSNGDILVETEGLWTDGGKSYRGLVRTAPLRRADGLQAHQRVRAMVLLGDLLGDHTLRVRAFYDGRAYPEDSWEWDPTGAATDLTSALNDDGWGDGDWGDGVWGNSSKAVTEVHDPLSPFAVIATDANIEPPADRVYQVKRGLARQKCSFVEFEISDKGCRTEGPAYTSLALEIGARGGTSRVPARNI